MTADVCMLLEGTYPFVRGGVSSWIHQILTGIDELSFSLVFVGGRRDGYGPPQYDLPDNVVHLETHYLEDALGRERPRTRDYDPALLEPVRELLDYLTESDRDPHTAGKKAIDQLLCSLGEPEGLSLDHFLFGVPTWQFIRERHMRDATAPFLDYFWTLRMMHGPVFQLARIAREAPRARVYHSVSTGYAGLLGSFLSRRRGRRLILSEHGIYTKERKIELNQADWLDKLRAPRGPSEREEGARIRKLWIRFFEGLGRLTYRSADPIISLYSGARERQHQDGADPARTQVISNGVDVARFREAFERRPRRPPHVIGLVGRLVPIKDIKTFLQAMRIVVSHVADAEALIVGSSEEDPAYAAECVTLVRSLGISERVHFLGHREVAEVFPRLGLLMLTSISEAQPLAVLEAFASGVPCITTDVGACREQIEGRTPDDKKLGSAGRVVPFADAEALALAAVELLRDEDAWHRCQRAARDRVTRHYTEKAMLGVYRELYLKAMEQ